MRRDAQAWYRPAARPSARPGANRDLVDRAGPPGGNAFFYSALSAAGFLRFGLEGVCAGWNIRLS